MNEATTNIGRSGSKTIRIAICDDHPVVRNGLVGMLNHQEDFEVVGEAGSGEEAINLVGAKKPHIILMDVRMPGMDGAETAAEILRRWPDTTVLMITSYDNDADVLTALEAGAMGYILKDADEEYIFSSIRNAVAGMAPLSPGVTRSVVRQFRETDKTILSKRESQILALLAYGHSNEEIGRELNIAVSTVKVYLAQILKKLGARDRTHAAAIGVQRNLINVE